MSAREWTDAQRAAIEDGGGALLVSAAAGSGKTAVLVERAVRLITREQAPVPADRLLILTFTNAAAEELRSRIGTRLEDEIARRGGDARLRAQRLLLRRAYVGTVDAFCQQLVREHFAQLGLPADIALGDEGTWTQLAQQALADTMEEMYADDAFAALSSLYGRARSDAVTEQAVTALYNFTRTLPRPAAQLRRLADMYDTDAPPAGTPWGAQLLAAAAEALEGAALALDDGLAAAGADASAAAYLPALRAWRVQTGSLARAVAGRDWDGAVALCRAFAPPAFAPVRGCNAAAKARVFAARDTAKKILDELTGYCFACTEAEYREDLATAAPMAAALCRAAALYAEKYYRAKLDDRALDFADFEHLALELLQAEDGARTETAQSVAARYDAVMVDEYQDTNDLQATLYECLAAPGGENLFYVGDVKQSVYRFRSANPGLFTAKKDGWYPYGGGRHPAVLALGHNFRSAPELIDGVNFIFGRLMSRRLGEVDYGEGERLIAGARRAVPGRLELCALHTENPEDETAFVAGKIAGMVAGGHLVDDGGGPRPCGYGDFCVLLRAGARMPLYASALAARGIPVTSATSAGITQTPEVLPMMAALAAISNPGDDVNLAATLLGPLFGFTPNEVTRLRAQTPSGGLWGAVTAAADAHSRDFVRQMAYYRTLATGASVGRLCEELAERTGYMAAVAAMEAGATRRENLLRFIGWAAQVSASGRGGLAGFVRKLQAGAGPQPPAAKSLPGHVALLTIHRSKGLEFPVCIVADTARAFNLREVYERVQLNAELGVGLTLRQGDSLYPTLQALAIRSRALRETLSEEMRVLYVALTRGKQQVTVTFSHKDPAAYIAARAEAQTGGRPHPYLLARGRSIADWMTTALLCHPALRGVMAGYNGEAAAAGEDGGLAVWLGVPPPAPTAGQRQPFRLTAAPDEALKSRLLQAFAASPQRAALADVPAKVSVSAIAKGGDTRALKRPSFMYKTGLTAAERGTAQHAFMQHARFEAAAQNLAAEVARLKEEGFLTAEQAAALDMDGARAFLASPLAARVAAAQTALREYDFITSIPAGSLDETLPPELAAEPVLVQGIADLVLVSPAGIEIVDYKTDHGLTAAQLAGRYRGQLLLYKAAVERRLGKPVERLTIWAFSLAAEIDVPLQP